jgi:predicted component of type VI protein secretion system
MPYGEGTDPIDSFDFEEFTPQAGLSGMLWGNSAIIAGLLLGATFSQQGEKMKPGSVLSLGDMPFYYYTDADGDQTALPYGTPVDFENGGNGEQTSLHADAHEREAGGAFGRF